MFIQQGKTNWLVVVIVALLAAATGAGLIAYISNTAFIATQTADLRRLKNQSTKIPIKIQNRIPMFCQQ